MMLRVCLEHRFAMPAAFSCRWIIDTSRAGPRGDQILALGSHDVPATNRLSQSQLSQMSQPDWQLLQIIAYCRCHLGHGLLTQVSHKAGHRPRAGPSKKAATVAER